MNQSRIVAEIVEVTQLVPQERIQHQEQTVAGETSQNIVENSNSTGTGDHPGDS